MESPHLIAQRILLFLKEHAPDEFNAKAISLAIGARPSTVRKELSRMIHAPNTALLKPHKGFYRHKTDFDIIRRVASGKPVKMHGVKLEGTCLNKNTKHIFDMSWKKHQSYRKRTYYSNSYEGRSLKATLHDSGFIEIWMNASDESTNLDAMSFERFRIWLSGLIPLEDIGNWLLKQIDINVDLRELNLHEVKHIRLKVFRNAWMSMYRKAEDLLRIEVSMIPKDLSLDEALNIMKTLVTIPTETSYLPGKSEDRDYSYG